jgi:hypothetical protein
MYVITEVCSKMQVITTVCSVFHVAIKPHSFIIHFPVGSQLKRRAPFGVSVITQLDADSRTPVDE